ncbi:biotin/lipoate A/B protein ligase family protein [Paenibacillus shunpengii]|uniref:Biotin/lipoate A/B protein ligase family protein n=1 Tax=Paenibacillus shunpengii TaxID=2054424 RepID=A0ABW5SQK8_9BACL|nr:lipoate--protein ligase family protein [Paenibacillus sp. PDC88]SDX17471.1 octanoyl-[GcvH]:protein N-octanoyltransferase [Paenibacillus sp. PDC88]
MASEDTMLHKFKEIQIWESPLMKKDEDVLEAFAWEEVMCRQVGLGHRPVAHLWRHENALVIGLRDHRLKQAEEAMQQFRNKGISSCVRPSGGAAVRLTRGVVNLSLILPNPGHAINIHDDFKSMVEYIRKAILPWGGHAVAGEIEGAYCPGDYDVAINGRKFCGIAQRRLAKAYLVTGFIIVEGRGDELTEDIIQFYDQAAGDADEGYPQVKYGSMGSLNELSDVPSAEAYMQSLIETIGSSAEKVYTGVRPSVPRSEVERTVAVLKERYD